VSQASTESAWPAVQVLKRINAEIEARRSAGENLAPPPKTAIAGPEYFGLNQPEVQWRNDMPQSRAETLPCAQMLQSICWTAVAGSRSSGWGLA
jgi:F/Y rich C-terminus